MTAREDNPGLWRPAYADAVATLRAGGEPIEEAARLLDAVEAATRATALDQAIARVSDYNERRRCGTVGGGFGWESARDVLVAMRAEDRLRQLTAAYPESCDLPAALAAAGQAPAAQVERTTAEILASRHAHDCPGVRGPHSAEVCAAWAETCGQVLPVWALACSCGGQGVTHYSAERHEPTGPVEVDPCAGRACPSCGTYVTGPRPECHPAPQPETAPDACARCGHPVPDHGPRGCTGTAGSHCACPRDAAGPGAYWPLVDPGAARWEQHGTTWTRDEYGNAHSLGAATPPDAEPGAPDDGREQLREQYAAVLLDGAGRLQPRHVADPDALITELLAVRDDALTTAQRRADTAEQRITAIHEALTVWRDRPGEVGLAMAIGRILGGEQPDPPAAAAVVRALRECDRIEREHHGQHDDDAARDTAARIRAALTPAQAQDGGA